MSPRTTIVLASVASAGIVWIAAEIPRPLEPGTPPRSSASPAMEATRAGPELDGTIDAPGDPTPAERMEAPPAASRRVQAVPSRAEAGGPGHLVLAAIDRETRRPVEAFTVRLASETRFAEERHDDPAAVLDLPLTPTTYDGIVLSPGYEPFDLAPVRIVSGETLRPAPVELLPGYGSIDVEATGADAFEGYSVELRGLGRRACVCCVGRPRPPSSPCPSCGYSKDASSLRIGPDGRARFTGLAHGPFRLRVVDVQGRAIGDDRGVDLGLGEAATVFFDVSQSRTVEVEFLDSDGVSLSAEWSRRLGCIPAIEEDLASAEESRVQEIPIQMEIRREGVGVARAELLPPPPPGASRFRSCCIGCSFGRGRAKGPTVDRARGPDDSLWTEPAAPRFEPVQLSCEVDARGLAVLAPLTTSELEIHFKADPLVADATVPPGRGPTRVRVRLRPEDTSSSEDSPIPAVSYLALERER